MRVKNGARGKRIGKVRSLGNVEAGNVGAVDGAGGARSGKVGGKFNEYTLPCLQKFLNDFQLGSGDFPGIRVGGTDHPEQRRFLRGELADFGGRNQINHRAEFLENFRDIVGAGAIRRHQQMRKPESPRRRRRLPRIKTCGG